MNQLTTESMSIDFKIQKVLKSLIEEKENIESEIKKLSETNEIFKEREYKLALQKINELIGKIRFNQLDKDGVLSPGEESVKSESMEQSRKKKEENENVGQGNSSKLPELSGERTQETQIKKSADHDGVMIALDIPDEQSKDIAIKNGEPPKDLHITLVYFGGAIELESKKEEIEAILEHLSSESEPIAVKLNKITTFPESDSQVPFIVSIDSKQLEEFRKQLVSILKNHNINYHDEYSYHPHITLKYLEPKEEIPVIDRLNWPSMIIFKEIKLYFGNNIKAYNLSSKNIGVHDVNPGKSDDIKKDAMSFSFPANNQQTAELDTKIKVLKEPKQGDDVTLNKRPFYNSIEKGFDPENDIYKELDELILKSETLIPTEQKLPRGSKTIAENIERHLYRNLRKTVNQWFDTVDYNSNIDDAIVNLKMSLMEWGQVSKMSTNSDVGDLYNIAYKAAMKKANLPKPTISLGVTHLTDKENGMNPAIDKFRDDIIRKISSIMKDQEDKERIPLYRTKRAIDSFLHKERTTTELIVKTETAKIANFGLIEAWGDAPNNYMYNYFWNSIEDDRTKPISRIRKEYNPLTYDECKFLWTHQEQLIGKSFMADQYNQRCSISREKIDKEFKGNRFAGRESEFRRTI